MWKWIAVILLFIITYSHCANFGPDNSYTCRCNNDEQCNRETGVCSDGCATGWSGASCQKQNVALGKPSGQVDVYGGRTPDLAVDGDRTTTISSKCSDTGNDHSIRWWRLDLQEIYPIKNITIYYRSEPFWTLASLNGYSVHVKTENQEPELCYKDNTVGILPPAVNNIQCSQVITGRYVNISNLNNNRHSRFLVLCEVEIYVCSVGTFGSNCTNFCHCLNNERCSETGVCSSGCADGWTGTTCNQRCEEGVYGEGCSKICSDRKCKESNLQCDSKTGECIDGCQPGYQSIECIQVCEAGVYGEECSKKCSDRKCKESNLLCDSITGECIDGCQPGYQSIDCIRECDVGTYGQDCLFSCSARFCQSVEEGSNIDGACVCLDGYEAAKTDARAKEDSEIGSKTIDHTWTIVGTISGLIVGIIIGVGVLFIMRRGSRTKDNNSVYNTVTGNRSSNNVTHQESIINQPVTQPSSNTSNHQDNNPYDGLSIAYQNENAYAHLQNL